MGKTILMAGAMFLLALTAVPVAAGEAAGGVDCFFAENRDDPLCRQTLVVAAAPAEDTAARSAAARADDGSVDCFFAENREHPLCREAP